MLTPRAGVYICHCGINIAATVNVAEVAEFAMQLPGVVIARDYTYMCSDPGQELIKKDIAELKLNRVVVASCSPRMHEPTFRSCIAEAGLNPYYLEMANIREQCSWIHPAGDETTQKAMQLVASAVAKALRLEPLEIKQVPVFPAALVIGGGIAGMQAALDIAEAGFQSVLVERDSQLGGHAARLHRVFPTLELADKLVNTLIARVTCHPRITVMVGAEVLEISGYVGNFRARIRQGEVETEAPAGAIIVATGFEVFDACRKPEFGYGVYPEVVTTLDLERLLNQPEALNHLQSIVFVQCVGSRDQVVGNPYCSRVCCMVAAKQAQLVRERLPEARVTVFYMDVRAFGKGCEEFYDQAREAGVLYRRGNPSEIVRGNGQLLVRVEDTLLGEAEDIPADLAVLAVGMEPGSGASGLARLLKLPRSADGFLMEAHPKLRPVETATAGVFLAGCCQGPKDIGDSLAQARAAAASALPYLIRGQAPVEAATAFIDEELCSGCGQCAQVCPYAALSLHPVHGVMRVNPVLCQGCGACAATCPSGAINLHHFTFDQVLAQVNALSDPAILMVRPWVHRPARARYQPVHWLITTQGDLLAATRRFLRDLWSNADLKGMLVMLQTAPDKPPSPVLVEDQTQLEASNPFAPLVNLNTAGLIAGLARSRPRERFAAILRPCELRALAEIQRQKPFNLDHWLIIGVDCLGSFSGEDFAWRLSKAGTVDQLTHLELRNARQGGIAPHRYRLACQMCSPLELPETDLYLGLLGLPVRELFLVTTKNQETADRLCLSQITAGLAEASLVSQHKRMLATTGERRSRFSERALRELDSGYPATAGEWAAHLSDCTFEQRCLEACPVYSLFGDGRQDLTDTVKRWVASCVECGLCEEACPEHLPLSVILRRLRKNISEEEVGRVGAPHLTT